MDHRPENLNRFSSSQNRTPFELAAVSHDAPFLRKINHHLEANLSDTSLTVEKLLPRIGMSRTDLHRKIVGQTGMTASEYIRHYRLRRAAHLLREKPDCTICQIARAVGFNSQSYFGRRFREMFGCSPVAFSKINPGN
jgi:AraC-like DNA-binding protein